MATTSKENTAHHQAEAKKRVEAQAKRENNILQAALKSYESLTDDWFRNSQSVPLEDIQNAETKKAIEAVIASRAGALTTSEKIEGEKLAKEWLSQPHILPNNENYSSFYCFCLSCEAIRTESNPFVRVHAISCILKSNHPSLWHVDFRLFQSAQIFLPPFFSRWNETPINHLMPYGNAYSQRDSMANAIILLNSMLENPQISSMAFIDCLQYQDVPLNFLLGNLFRQLLRNLALKNLEITYTPLSDIIITLKGELSVNRTLTRLALIHCNLQPVHLQTLGEALLENNHLKTLLLGDRMSLGTDYHDHRGFRNFYFHDENPNWTNEEGYVVNTNRRIYEPLDLESMRTFAVGLRCSRVTLLDLSGIVTELDSAMFEMFITIALTANEDLQTLYLASFPLVERVRQKNLHLYPLILRLRLGLQVLDLCGSYLGDAGLALIIKALQEQGSPFNPETSGLSKRILEDEEFTESLAERNLPDYTMRPLYSLDLSSNGITDVGIKALANALPHTMITHLFLRENPHITREGAYYLGNALRMHRKLAVLDLRRCYITDIGVASIARALHRNAGAHLLHWVGIGDFSSDSTQNPFHSTKAELALFSEIRESIEEKYTDRFDWAAVCVFLAFVRSNQHNPFRTSISPLIPSILYSVFKNEEDAIPILHRVNNVVHSDTVDHQHPRAIPLRAIPLGDANRLLSFMDTRFARNILYPRRPQPPVLEADVTTTTVTTTTITTTTTMTKTISEERERRYKRRHS